ncbi:MAG TPA: 50S ribosomal protein L10 [Candidatus Paceibacterota bacterium]|nr:50S ribosomal protein L10 [Candidatus Paceibacterota bacterium]
MLTRKRKEEIVDQLADKIKRQKSLIFTDAQGVKVKDIQKIRRELKKLEAEYKVAKKSLMEMALKKEKKEIDLSGFNGALAVSFGYQDPLSLIKVLTKLSRKNADFKILGGMVEDKVLSVAEIKELSKIPSKEILLAKIVGCIKGPINGLVNTIEGNLRNLVGVLNAIKINK